MFDGSLLKEKIENEGLSIKNLSSLMGISCASFYRKVNGQSEFTVSEAGDIISCLSLGDKEIRQIFFS